jgi:hypothetical protein
MVYKRYKNYALFIQKDSRCCSKHFDDNGDLIYEDFFKMKKSLILFEKSPIELIDLCSAKTVKLTTQLDETFGIFDKFRDIASLDENVCIQIIGWNRKEFVRFSSLIENVRYSAGRTKEQLVAIYRYRSRKGLDQITLSLLKCNSSQQQISFYLATMPCFT